MELSLPLMICFQRRVLLKVKVKLLRRAYDIDLKVMIIKSCVYKISVSKSDRLCVELPLLHRTLSFCTCMRNITH